MSLITNHCDKHHELVYIESMYRLYMASVAAYVMLNGTNPNQIKVQMIPATHFQSLINKEEVNLRMVFEEIVLSWTVVSQMKQRL